VYGVTGDGSRATVPLAPSPAAKHQKEEIPAGFPLGGCGASTNARRSEEAVCLAPAPFFGFEAYDVCSLPMTQPAKDSEIAEAVALLVHYSFDLEGYTAEELVEQWRQTYPSNWLRLAVIEALYQGRYKGISVSQILAIWQRLSQARSHFTADFERLIVQSLPRQWGRQASKSSLPKSKTAPASQAPTFDASPQGAAQPQNAPEKRTKPAPPIQRFQPVELDPSFCDRLRHLTESEENHQDGRNR